LICKERDGPKKEQERYIFRDAGDGPDEDADKVQILNNKVQTMQR
jgi:hypothetical protein